MQTTLVDIHNQPLSPALPSPPGSRRSIRGQSVVAAVRWPATASPLPEDRIDQIDAGPVCGMQLSGRDLATAYGMGGDARQGVSIDSILDNPEPYAQSISNALDRAAQTVEAALTQCIIGDPAAEDAIAGIFGLSVSDVGRYLPALLDRFTKIGDALRIGLRYRPDRLALTPMHRGPCATFSPHRSIVKLNTDTFFDRSERQQAHILIHVAAHAVAGADDYFLLPEGRHAFDSRFDDDYAESAHRLFAHPRFNGASTLRARTRICEDRFLRKMGKPCLADAIETFKSNAVAKMALLLENADTLTLTLRVLSEIQAWRETPGADTRPRERPAEGLTRFYLKQARGFRRQTDFSTWWKAQQQTPR